MRRQFLFLVLTGLMSVFLVASASAQATTDPRPQTDTEGTSLDASGNDAGNGAAAAQRIETMFGVTAAQVDALRADNLGYGEIVIALSLAQNLQGGLTQDNINQVVAMRQGPPVMGWGQVAKSLGLNLGQIVSSLEKDREGDHGKAHEQDASLDPDEKDGAALASAGGKDNEGSAPSSDGRSGGTHMGRR